MRPRNDWNSVEEIGERLRAIRHARDASLGDIADPCELSVATLSRIENGKQDLSVRTLLALCDALDCSPNDVLATESRDPQSVLAALKDVDRAKEAFRSAANHVEAMERRLREFTRGKKRA